MALTGLYCADVPFKKLLTHSDLLGSLNPIAWPKLIGSGDFSDSVEFRFMNPYTQSLPNRRLVLSNECLMLFGSANS